MLKVGINAYGTIGKRVADAITKQDDIEVVGVVKAHPNYMSYVANKRFKLFVPDNSALKSFENTGIKVEGTLENLMDDSELIVDSTPEGLGEEYKKIYEKKKKKAIFQGGGRSRINEPFIQCLCKLQGGLGKGFRAGS